MEFGKPDWKTFQQGIQKEWILTNGIGGYASSTIIGANTRRYHGLLIASFEPPTQRFLILSQIQEHVIMEGRDHSLFSNEGPFNNNMGYKYLERVTVDHLPAFLYRIEDLYIEKKVSMVYGQNKAVIIYNIVNGPRDAVLKLVPLVNCRKHDGNSCKAYMDFTQQDGENCILIKAGTGKNSHEIKLYCSDGSYSRQDTYFTNMKYAVEIERGLPALDDHFIPGVFEIKLSPNERRCVTFIATTEQTLGSTDGPALAAKEEQRVKQLREDSGFHDDFAARLAEACDQFIVYRKSTGMKTVIAGYPWFTDWGRDTMISLPGLTLVTRRFQDAKEILLSFLKYRKYGLLPNMFPDEGEEPLYNTVDSSLWYFEAVSKYLKYTEDYEFVREYIYPALKEIITAYSRGTCFDIKVDRDSLLSAGREGSQLTWMDVKVDGWVVTPRHGKAVEINALWYNALMIMSKLSEKFGIIGTDYSSDAAKVKESFVREFWNDDAQCLYDVITDKEKSGAVRPNQIIALSLTYPVVDGDMAKKVVNKVWRELYTAYGLRTLSPREKEYIGI
jgi:predicted glycogen debranching enzyme